MGQSSQDEPHRLVSVRGRRWWKKTQSKKKKRKKKVGGPEGTKKKKRSTVKKIQGVGRWNRLLKLTHESITGTAPVPKNWVVWRGCSGRHIQKVGKRRPEKYET